MDGSSFLEKLHGRSLSKRAHCRTKDRDSRACWLLLACTLYGPVLVREKSSLHAFKPLQSRSLSPTWAISTINAPKIRNVGCAPDLADNLSCVKNYVSVENTAFKFSQYHGMMFLSMMNTQYRHLKKYEYLHANDASSYFVLRIFTADS